MIGTIQFIAEVKTTSPFGYVSSKDWHELFDVANEYGDIISIHTDARWGGSFDLLKKARRLTKKPILAKGLHETDDHVLRALECGADYVLVVGRVPRVFPEKCLIEPLTLDELQHIPSHLKVVWNSRNLSDGGLKKETFEDARKLWKGWLCQASNIKTVTDIQPSANAVLIGANLEQFCKSISIKV